MCSDIMEIVLNFLIVCVLYKIMLYNKFYLILGNVIRKKVLKLLVFNVNDVFFLVDFWVCMSGINFLVINGSVIKSVVNIILGIVNIILMLWLNNYFLNNFCVLNNKIKINLVIIGEIVNGKLISVIKIFFFLKLNFVINYVVIMLKMVFKGIVISIIISVSLIVVKVFGFVIVVRYVFNFFWKVVIKMVMSGSIKNRVKKVSVINVSSYWMILGFFKLEWLSLIVVFVCCIGICFVNVIFF